MLFRSQGHIKNLSEVTELSSEEIISRLGIAVASEIPDYPEDDPLH